MEKFSSSSFASILKGLKSTGEILSVSLSSLLELLVFANENLLRAFPTRDFAKVLCQIASSSEHISDKIISLQCINLLLNADPQFHKFLRNHHIYEIIRQEMRHNDNQMLIENILRIVSYLSYVAPDEVGQSFLPHHLLSFIPSVSIAEQRNIMQSISHVAQNFVSSHYSSSLIHFLPYMNDNDLILRQFSTYSFLSITNAISPHQIPLEILNPIIRIIINTNDISCAVNLIEILCKTIKDSTVSRYIIDHLPDIEGLLFCKASLERKDLSAQILDFIQVILPSPKLPKALWSSRVGKPVNESVLNAVTPVLIKYLCDRNEHEKTCVSLLATCVSHRSIDSSQKLLNTLIRCARSARAAPYVMAIACGFRNRSDVVRSGLLKTLTETRVSGGAQEWYRERIKSFADINGPGLSIIPASIAFSQNFDLIIDYIKKENVLPWEFLNTKLIDKCCTMLQMGAGGKSDLSPLVDLCYGLLVYFPFPHEKDPLKISNTTQFARKEVLVRASNSRNHSFHFVVPIISDFMALEGLYNISTNSALTVILRDSLCADKRFCSMMQISPEEDFSSEPMFFAFLCRALSINGYVRCSFVIDKCTFSVYDSLTYAFSRTCSSINQMRKSHLDVKILENEALRSEFIVNPFSFPEIRRPIELINMVYEKRPDISIYNPFFSSYIISQLSNPILSILMFNPAIRLVYMYPFLFNFSDRVFCFKLTSLPPSISCAVHHDKFSRGSDDLNIRSFSIKCIVDRNNLFYEGCELFQKFGRGYIRTEISFSGEKGFGDGPTQEFFNDVSKCFCKTSLNIWRNDALENEYAMSELGLFPRPDSDTKVLELLGLFVSKAIVMEHLIDIPFNPAFFKLLLGQNINIQEVDPTLARSLSQREGLYGLTFTYPGIPSLELKPRGSEIDVNENNVDEFIYLVKDYTCGQYMFHHIKPLVAAFSTNIQIESLRIFSPIEICHLVIGEDPGFTIEDMQLSIKTEHGYDSKSPEIQMFIDVVCTFSPSDKELFIKFVTGSGRLPIGGFSALQPPLTIAKRIAENTNDPDKTLPSVMTCTNYFKLPPYSSRDVMKSKILQAIHECQKVFELS